MPAASAAPDGGGGSGAVRWTWTAALSAAVLMLVTIVVSTLTLESSLPREALRSSLAYHLERYRESAQAAPLPPEAQDDDGGDADREDRAGRRPACDVTALLDERVAAVPAKRATVCLHSHGRSGSTLASSLFFSTTNIFFLDEPLRDGWRGHRDLGLRNVDRAVMMTRCEFGDSVSFVANQANRINTNSYSHLEKRPPWLRGAAKGVDRGVATAVLGAMRRYCEASEITAMKEIRLMRAADACPGGASSLLYLLTKYEEARVIHLVRHPHEVVKSQYVCAASSRRLLPPRTRHGADVSRPRPRAGRASNGPTRRTSRATA
ncbi:MAG: hypothetical protein VXZ39_12930 [Planctomycetota bacterium]|nr:hypothetical protein [Planctomycetota bacterium]